MSACITFRAHSALAFAAIILLLSPSPLCGQEDVRRGAAVERALERLLERSVEDDASLLIEQLERYIEAPLCLHSATLEELESIPLLTPTLALAIHSAMSADSVHGWNSLRRLPGMDRDAYALLRVCAILDCGKTTSLPDALQYRGRIQQEDRPRAGFLDGRYPGGRARIQQRITAQGLGHVRAGLLQERDPGESDFADHLCGYMSVEALGIVDRAVLGDFTVAGGNGLVFWQSFGLSKGSDALAAGRRGTRMLAPYASATEGLFYRGAAVQLGFGAVSLLTFASRNALDATIDESTGTAGAFGIDGLHRSPSESQRRQSVREDLYGGRAQWEIVGTSRALRLGTSAWHAQYSVPSDPNTPFGFRGDRAWVVGGDASFTHGRLQVFGEMALCHLDRAAALLGLRAPLHAQADALLLWRSYNERFVNIHGFGFGERGGELQNEQGLYLGLRVRPAGGLRIDAWVDVFAFPNRTYLLHLPTSGGELLLAAAWDISESLILNLRFTHGEKDNTVAAMDSYGRDIRPLARRQSTALRAELISETESGVRLRLRADHSFVRYDAWKNGDDGLLLLADCRVALTPELALTGRIAIIESGGYDGRVYQFEHDVPGVMQNVALYGRGLRSYLVADWRPSPWIRFGVKYGISIRDAARSNGDGADAVDGDALGKGTVQVEVLL
jgi:hypothetical protein